MDAAGVRIWPFVQGLPPEDQVSNVADLDRSFSNPSTHAKHSANNVMEFYAEGYSVFHGNVQICQGRMLYMAPGLYDYLEREARADGLLRPDKDALKKFLDEFDPNWRAWEPKEEKKSSKK